MAFSQSKQCDTNSDEIATQEEINTHEEIDNKMSSIQDINTELDHYSVQFLKEDDDIPKNTFMQMKTKEGEEDDIAPEESFSDEENHQIASNE